MGKGVSCIRVVPNGQGRDIAIKSPLTEVAREMNGAEQEWLPQFTQLRKERKIQEKGLVYFPLCSNTTFQVYQSQRSASVVFRTGRSGDRVSSVDQAILFCSVVKHKDTRILW